MDRRRPGCRIAWERSWQQRRPTSHATHVGAALVAGVLGAGGTVRTYRTQPRGGGRRPSRFALLALALPILTGCESLTVCNTGAEPAFEITVVSKADGSPVDDPVVIVDDGERVDTLGVSGNVAEGPAERSGVFDVRIESEGFFVWAVEDVRVEAGECGPRTRKFTVELVPEPGPEVDGGARPLDQALRDESRSGTSDETSWRASTPTSLTCGPSVTLYRLDEGPRSGP